MIRSQETRQQPVFVQEIEIRTTVTLENTGTIATGLPCCQYSYTSFRLHHIPFHHIAPFSMSSLKANRITAHGRGAVAVIRIQSDNAADASLLRQHFVSASGRDPVTLDISRIFYGHWGSEDVVIIRTQQFQWEVHCHGGEAAVGRILSDLDIDTTACDRTSDLEQRDLEQRLLEELLKCRTQRTARYLLAQQQGVLAEFLNRVNSATSLDDVAADKERFLSWQSFAAHLTEPWTVAVVGRPNAGKSSLLNAIVGYERSIVFDQPGTTRDRIEADVVIDGWPFRLVDTAGVRQNVEGTIEKIGVDAARETLSEADACLLVVDSAVGWTGEDATLLSEVADACPVCIIWNKTDLSEAKPLSGDKTAHTISTSATSGNGIKKLLDWLPQVLIPLVPSFHEPLPIAGTVDTFC